MRTLAIAAALVLFPVLPLGARAQDVAEPLAEAPEEQPAPPPAEPPAAPPRSDRAMTPPASTGQWIYTQQYGWVWSPYGDAYSYVPPEGEGEPYEYVYYPDYGWMWVAAPWIWGIGPWPWFGVYGAVHFGWYGHGWWRTPERWHYHPGAFHGYGHDGFRGGSSTRTFPGASRAGSEGRGAPSGRSGGRSFPTGGSFGGGRSFPGGGSSSGGRTFSGGHTFAGGHALAAGRSFAGGHSSGGFHLSGGGHSGGFHLGRGH